ncbi:hypothetical protein BC832DRAFT_85503 [Gaertneriomyces semiglobifer]|nr:hypothetical protein BC832DRAFT_85503 [Gaertneriomyces semiglobifer]
MVWKRLREKGICSLLLAAACVFKTANAQAEPFDFSLSSNGVWPHGSTQSITFVLQSNIINTLFVESVTIRAGTASLITCADQKFSDGQVNNARCGTAVCTTVACAVVIPPNFPSVTTIDIAARWKDCREVPITGTASPFCDTVTSQKAVRVLLGDAAVSTTASATSTTEATSTAASPTPSRPPALTATPSPANKEEETFDNSSGTSVAIIIGAIIGAILVVGLIGGIYWKYFRHRDDMAPSESLAYLGRPLTRKYTAGRGGPAVAPSTLSSADPEMNTANSMAPLQDIRYVPPLASAYEPLTRPTSPPVAAAPVGAPVPPARIDSGLRVVPSGLPSGLRVVNPDERKSFVS